MTRSVIRKCKCGYHIIVYVIVHESGKAPQFRYFDGHSGNYEQTYICPGCSDRLDYNVLEG